MVTVEVGHGDEQRWLVLGVTRAEHHDAAHDGAAGRAPATGADAAARRSRSCCRRLPAPSARRIAMTSERCSRCVRRAALGRRPCRRCRRFRAAQFAQTDRQRRTCRCSIGQGAGGTSYSVPIQTLLFFTALSFLPAVLLLMTGFTRIVIVLSLLRQALGTQAAPPNQVIVGLSLFLTFFVMGPTLDKVYAEAYQPYADEQDRLRRSAQARRGADARVHAEADAPGRRACCSPSWPSSTRRVKTADVPFKVLVPAFVTSELKSAFQIGFLIFIPFLIIDMIVASVLMWLGMMMLSPVLIALPFKLMLFVLADGWNLLLGSLAASFAT